MSSILPNLLPGPPLFPDPFEPPLLLPPPPPVYRPVNRLGAVPAEDDAEFDEVCLRDAGVLKGDVSAASTALNYT